MNDDILLESSLNRVYQHAQNQKIPFAIISAERAKFRNPKKFDKDGKEIEDLTQSPENRKRSLNLAKQIQNEKYGYFWLNGVYPEDAEDDKGHKIPNKEILVKEKSIFIIPKENDDFSKFKKFVIKLMKKFNQDSIVYKDENTEIISWLYQTGKIKNLGKFSPLAINNAYSVLKNKKKFTFVDTTKNVSETTKNLKKVIYYL